MGLPAIHFLTKKQQRKISSRAGMDSRLATSHGYYLPPLVAMFLLLMGGAKVFGANEAVEQHLRSARSYQEQQRLLDAVLEYQEVLRLEPQHERVSISLAMLLSQMGRKKEAEELCRGQLSRYPNLFKLHLTLASFLIPEKRYEEAGREIAAFFKEAAGKTAENAQEQIYAHYLQGIHSMAQKREEDGIQSLLKVVEMDPEFVAAHMELGEVYGQTSQTYEKAVQHFNRALELNPDQAAAHGSLGKVLLNMERIQPAIEHLQKSIELDPSFFPGYSNLAKAYRKQGETDKAKEILARFQGLHSERENQLEKRKRALALFQEGEQSLSNGKLSEALKAFQECRELAPERSQFDHIFPPDRGYFGLAFTSLAQGNLEQASRNIQKALELYPYDARYYETYASILETAGNHLAAISTIEKATQLNPAAHSYHNVRGNLLFKVARYEEAVSAYRRAAELDPQNPSYRLNLSSALFKSGGYADGQKEKELYLKLLAEGRK